MCSEVDYPGVTKYHLRVTFYASFDSGATYDTLDTALKAYNASGTPAAFKARPHASRVPAPNNPIISGLAIPQPFPYIMGDAGAASEIQIDWNLEGVPSVDDGVLPATGRARGLAGLLPAERRHSAGEPGHAGRYHSAAGDRLDGRLIRHYGRPGGRALRRRRLDSRQGAVSACLTSRSM